MTLLKMMKILISQILPSENFKGDFIKDLTD